MLARLIIAALATLLLAPLTGAAEDQITQGTLIWRDDSCFFFVL